MALIAAYIVPHPPLIVHEVGRGEEAAVSATLEAYREVAAQISALAPDVLVLVSPHAPLFADGFFVDLRKGEQRDDFSVFGAPSPEIHFRMDDGLSRQIIEQARAFDLLTADEAEALHVAGRHDHGSLVPLYFIARAGQSSLLSSKTSEKPGLERGSRQRLDVPFPVVRLAFSGLDPSAHFNYGCAINEAIKASGKRVVFVASGDLSHKLTEHGPYGFAAEGPEFDRMACDILRSGKMHEFINLNEAFCDRAAECGLRSFQILAGVLDGAAWTSKLLSYQGPFGVGYAVASFLPAQTAVPVQTSEEDAYPALARRALEHFILERRPLSLSDRDRKALPPEMTKRRAGVFVSLHKDGELRGCIGTLAETTDSIAAEIIQNAVSAGTGDPRFSAVKAAELPFLEYSVDVLGPMEPVIDRSQLDVRRYGVVVSDGWRRGLLLPDLEGVDSVEEQLRIACLKAGLSPQGKFRIERFEVIRHEGPAPSERSTK